MAVPTRRGWLLALIVAVGCAPSPLASESPTATASPTPRPTPVRTPAPTFGPEGDLQKALVVDIVDGDTIKVDIGGTIFTVRYIGIDTPETVDPGSPVEWLGPQASAANQGLVGGKTVHLEKDVSETDSFDRLLRYVWLEIPTGWLLVNRELVRLGFAAAVSYPPDVRYQELFLEAERQARLADRGLWGASPTPVPTSTPAPTPTPAPPPPPPPPPPSNCHASYTPVCLTPGIGDYDCAGGSGNGPNYVQGPFYVVGYDEYDLDRDGDGIGCES